ncbi:hypothetical protein ACFLTC_00835 [Chloroflexota bacterium]
MTEELRVNPETEKDSSPNGGDTEQRAIWYALLVSGLLITGGAVLSLVMAYKKVTETALWLIPVVMYWAGGVLAIKPLAEGKARIRRRQEEIVTRLDQLDPVAKT